MGAGLPPRSEQRGRYGVGISPWRNPARRQLLPFNLAVFRDWLEKLNSTDPATSRVIVLTTYSTWDRLTVIKDAVRKVGNIEDDAEAEEVADQSNESEPEAEVVPVKKQSSSRVANAFAVMILDEAHKLKSRCFKTFACVADHWYY